MSDAVLVAIIVSVPPTLVGFLNFWMNRKIVKAVNGNNGKEKK